MREDWADAKICRDVLLTILSLWVAVARIGGVKGQAFQAAAHLLVGGLAPLWAGWSSPRRWAWWTLESFLFWALCVVETLCFLAGKFLH